jgi:hypothetical protein
MAVSDTRTPEPDLYLLVEKGGTRRGATEEFASAGLYQQRPLDVEPL